MLLNTDIITNYNKSIDTIASLVSFNEVIGSYLWGSYLYGTNNENSDFEFVVVTDIIKWNVDPLETDIVFKNDYGNDFNSDFLIQFENIDIHVISKDRFNEMVENCSIMALECIFQEKPIKKYYFSFNINPVNLRKSISAVASNSWVKAKKKVNQGDVYTGLKSLFHSIRILDYGLQIIQMNKIYDYKSCNHIFDEIFQMYFEDSWAIEEIQSHFKQMQNQRATTFRHLIPMEKDNKC